VPLLASVPLLLVGLVCGVLCVLVTRALRDEAAADAVRTQVRRVGETHRAVVESRGVHPGADPRSDGSWRLRS